MNEGQRIRRGIVPGVALVLLVPFAACTGPLDPVVPDDDEDPPDPGEGDKVGYVTPAEGVHLASTPPEATTFPESPFA